jgi:hypothetical protein
MFMIPPFGNLELRLPKKTACPEGRVHRWQSSLLFLSCRGRLRGARLVPAVEARKVAPVPCLAESRQAQIPVGTNFARHSAQIVPEICDRRATPKPVAVLDAVDHEARLENERVRNHRIVFGVGILLDVEVFLNFSLRVGEEGPLGADRRTKLLNRVVVVGGDRGDLGVRHRDLRVERSELQMLLVLLRAIVAACEREDQRVVALEFTELALFVRVIGQLVVGENASGHDVRAHGWTPLMMTGPP